MKGFSKAVDNSKEFAIFEKGDEPMRSNQGIVSGNNKTVDFTGVVRDLNLDVNSQLSIKLEATKDVKTDSIALDNPPIDTVDASTVLEPIYHRVGEDLINISDSSTGLLRDCYGNDMKYAPTNGIVLDESSIIDQDQGRQGWYKFVDINSIGITYHYDLSMSSDDVFEEELETIDIPDDDTVMHSNILDIFRLEDPKMFNLYDVPRAQMDGGAKCTVTNNLNLLCKVKWYNRWFRPRCQMKGATSEQTIIYVDRSWFRLFISQFKQEKTKISCSLSS